MKKAIQKIYILGTSGSGKTFLANKLARELKIKPIDLDDIYWIKKYTKKRDKKIMKKRLKKLTKRKSWIIEGVYGSWIKEAIKKADLVIWLDPPFRILSWRIFMRYLKKRDSTLKDTLNLIKYAGKYKKETYSASYKSHKALLKEHKINFISIKNKKQLNEFLKDFLK